MRTAVRTGAQKSNRINLNTVAVKSALLIRGWTVSDLARRAGYGRSYLSSVLHNLRGSRRVQRRIARILKKPLAELTAETPRRSY